MLNWVATQMMPSNLCMTKSIILQKVWPKFTRTKAPKMGDDLHAVDVIWSYPILMMTLDKSTFKTIVMVANEEVKSCMQGTG